MFNLGPEEKILLLGRIGKFVKRMLRIRNLSDELLNDKEVQRLQPAKQDKLVEIKKLASKKEDED